MSSEVLGLYLYVPFCSSICNYCNFNRGLFDAALKARYVAALEQEILRAGRGEPADTIYFGGGTPSLLEPDELGGLIRACREAFLVAPGAEITMEANPGTFEAERLDVLPLEVRIEQTSIEVAVVADGPAEGDVKVQP